LAYTIGVIPLPKKLAFSLSMVLKETKDGNHYDRYKKIALQGDEQMRHVHG
jgi:hypothetical protein